MDISYLAQNKRLEALLENAEKYALHWAEKLVELESEVARLKAQLEHAKAALAELAELSNYSINAYSEVQWDGPIAGHPAKICKHPWNYADKILEELESSSAPLTITPDKENTK